MSRYIAVFECIFADVLIVYNTIQYNTQASFLQNPKLQ